MAITIEQPILWDGTMFGAPCDGGRNVETRPVTIPMGEAALLKLTFRSRADFQPVLPDGAASVARWRFEINDRPGAGHVCLFATESVTLDAEGKAITIDCSASLTDELVAALGERPVGEFPALLTGYDADTNRVCSVATRLCVGNTTDEQAVPEGAESYQKQLAKKADLDENGKVPASQLPECAHPVTSVNGKTGDVTLDASDVQAAPASHASDTSIHVTPDDKTAWNGKQNALTQTQLDNIAAVPNKANDNAVVHLTGEQQTISAVLQLMSTLYAESGVESHGDYLLTWRVGGDYAGTLTISQDTISVQLANEQSARQYRFQAGGGGTLALLENIAPAFVYFQSYDVSDLCTSFDADSSHMGTWLYKCIAATDGSTPPETDTTHWTLATVEDVLAALRAGKQDTISDLATIRAGAAAGATAVQPSGLANYVQKSQTAGLLKNDGTVDTNTYLTTAPVTSVNGQTGAVTLAIPDVSGKLDANKRNLLDYTSGTTLAPETAVYRSALNSDGTFPTITATGIPTAAAYYQFELELAVPSTVPSTITGPTGWVWLDGHGLPDPADLSGGETICISVRLDCTARTFLASVWRVA